MTQNLQIATEPGQQTASAPGDEQVQDARALIDHLNFALSAEENGATGPKDGPDAANPSFGEAPSFARAIGRQTDQIQYLVQQINRLDSDNEVARLRAVVIDLCGALTDVTLRMKQDTSQAGGKINSLMEAMTIIGGAPGNIESCENIAMLLPAAKAAAERLASLERGANETRSAISALQDGETGSLGNIRDLSAGLIRLNESVAAERSEVAELKQRIGSVNQALTQALARLDGAIDAYRREFAGLQQRIGSADRAIVQGLARLDSSIEAHRGEFVGWRQRIESADQALTKVLARLTDTVEAQRGEIAGLQQRTRSAEQAIANGLARLDHVRQADRNEIAGLQQRIGSTDRTLTEGFAALGEHATVLRNDLGQVHQRLASVEASTAAHSAIREKIDGLSRRLEALERDAAAELKNWKQRESERNVDLANKLEILEQKNQSLGQGAEQMTARLEAAEQTIATVIQRQKTLSAVHDRVVRLLLANPDLSI